jgi:hypothetical protein
MILKSKKFGNIVLNIIEHSIYASTLNKNLTGFLFIPLLATIAKILKNSFLSIFFSLGLIALAGYSQRHFALAVN